MSSPIVVVVRTARHRYAVRRDDMTELRLIDADAELPPDDRRQPYLKFDLGALLDPDDRSQSRRRRALVVPLRRKNIVLLVDYVENFHEHTQVQPLPAILQARLREPWAVGVLLIDDQPVVQLDLRAVARSALLLQPAA